jgi:DNA-binding transcriptional LysR family regulator
MIRHARMALASLARAHDDLVALKSGLTGRVEVGVHLESSHVLLDKFRRAMLDFVIGRVQEGDNGMVLIHAELTEEPACAVVRPGHLLLESRRACEIFRVAWVKR